MIVGFVVGGVYVDFVVEVVGICVELFLTVGGEGGGGFRSETDRVRRDPTMVFPGVLRRPLSSDRGGGGGGEGIMRCVVEEALMAPCAAV